MIKQLWSVAVVASLVTLGAEAEPNGRKGLGGFTGRPQGGVSVKPTRPGGGMGRPQGGVTVTPTVPGGVRPRPIGTRPPVVGIVRPPVVGIVRPPVVGIVRPPVVGIVRPPVVGIRPIGIRPVGIRPTFPVGIKPTFPIGIIKPPVKPPVVIGIIKPPVKPPVIGIVIPPKHPKPHWPKHPHFPHYPHYPKYPHWTHFPHCPGVGYPIVISQPYPVYTQMQAGQVILNLQCTLPENANVQDLTAVNVNLMRTANGSVEVFGVLNDAAQQSMNITTMATGPVQKQLVNLKMADGDEVYLEAFQTEQGQTYYQGSIRLLGRADNKGMVCQLTELGATE